jgi:hypothetical protein
MYEDEFKEHLGLKGKLIELKCWETTLHDMNDHATKTHIIKVVTEEELG